VLAPLLLFDHYLWTQSAGRIMFVWTLALLVSKTAERDPQMRSTDRFGLTGSRTERPAARAGRTSRASNSSPYVG
jgi:hypothetical protein